MKKKIKLFLSIIFVIQFIFSIKSIAIESNTSASYVDLQKAMQEVMWAYYMRGENIQYSTQRTNTTQGYYSPEEATSQNRNYSVCSGFPRYVYRNMFGIVTPPLTSSLLSYAKKYIGTSGNVERKEVIGFGKTDENNNQIFKMQNKNGETYDTLTNPTTNEIIPYLKIGDVLTYTGHSIMIYDLVYDENGNVVNAYIIESGYGSGGNYIKTKIPENLKVTNNKDTIITFKSSSIQYLYSTSGSIMYSGKLLTQQAYWKDLQNNKDKEFSILRFVSVNDENQIVLNYVDSYTSSETVTYTDEVINIDSSAIERVNNSKIYIEKTVDKWYGSIVEIGDNLTYKIIIKNNSEADYTSDLQVNEELSDYVAFVSSVEQPSINGNVLSWNIGKLKAGEEKVIEYTVKVKDNAYNKTIISTGKVGNIPSSTIKNKVSNNLSLEEKTKIVDSYEKLKNNYSGKTLIDNIYKDALNYDLNLNDFQVTDLIQDTNPSSISITSIVLNKDNYMYGAMLNNYWNIMYHKDHTLKSNQQITEYYLYTFKPYSDDSRREDTVYEENFQTGDILIYNNENDVIYTYNSSNYTVTSTDVTYENGEYAYIYIEEQGFIGINHKGEDSERNSFNKEYYNTHNLTLNSNGSEETDFANFQTLLGKDNYVILRPSIGFDLLPMELEINYSTTSLTNEDVVVTISSNEEMLLIDGWELSEDKKTATKTYSQNTTEELKVYDYGGNEKSITIKIENIDKIKPTLNVNYSTTLSTNKDVTVAITANEEIQGIVDWTLSEDKKVLTKTYAENKTENIEVKDLAGNTSTEVIEIKNIDKEKPIVQVKYSTKELTLNDVTVTIEANEELQEIEGWQLSDDKKHLSKTYTKNDEENITIYDLAGNSIVETIKIENIDKDKPEYEIQYSTTLSTNEDVTVTITANEEIQSIDGWNLSEDKKTLTKTYTENTEEEIIIKDFVGNSSSKTIIKISNIDKINPKLDISYSITEKTNQDVTVTITSNEPIQEIEGWNLSTDRKVLTKKFTSNTEENITIYDLAGNTISDTIKISNIDKVAPKIEVKYSTISATNKDVTVTITSDEIIKSIDGWALSSDKKQLSKTFNKNGEEEITIIDEAGNSVSTKIKVSNINKNEIEKDETIDDENSDITTVSVDSDTTTAKMILPNTGGKNLLIFIAIFIVISAFMGIRLKKYKEIK